MTTEELLEAFCNAGRHIFTTQTSKRSPEIRKLLRHEPVMIEGVEYSCLKELVVEKTAEHIRSVLPNAEIEVELSGNDSTVTVDLTDEEKRKLTSSLYVFLKENNCLTGRFIR